MSISMSSNCFLDNGSIPGSRRVGGEQQRLNGRKSGAPEALPAGMKRTKASVEVKRVVGALCRLLAALGVDSVPVPESFRRAKFGGGTEEDQFWELLSCILQKTDVISSEVGLKLGGASENRRFVAAGLLQAGYRADWMYERQEGRSFSSRDLLLALGWMLAAGTLEKLMTQRVQQLDKTLLIPVNVNLQLSSELQLDSASLRRLHWLVGRLRHQGRILLSMLQEKTRLLHAVFSASLSSAASPSIGQNSVMLKEDWVCVQQLCELLESYLDWRRVEDVFWTWMDSVVDCHLAAPVITSPPHALSGSPGLCQHETWGLERPDDTMEGPSRSREDVKDRGEPGPPSLPPLLDQVYRAKLRAERTDRRTRSEDLHSRTEAPELEASKSIQLLLQAEALLLERRDQQRLANRTQLQEMIDSREGLVLIPP